MNVWVDGAAFENDRQHGVWRVFYEIMSRTKNDVDYTLWLRDAPKRPLPEGVRIYQDFGRHQFAPHQIAARWRRRQNLRMDPACLRKADLFHSTGFTFPVSENIRSIVTVHDLIAESHFFICIREVEEGISIKRQALERAVSLPCDSETTKKELVAFYPHLESRASVVRLGYEHLVGKYRKNHPLVTPTPATSDGNQNVLYVGMRTGYKNFRVILEAMNNANWPKKVMLAVIGSPFSDAEKMLIRKLGLTHRISHLGTVTDAQLRQMYNAARCLVFPSLQEGFGLPCLEAHANRCPLLCSDIEVFHEVAGVAALFFDPRLGESVAEQVNRIGEPSLRKEFLERGLENLRRFSWDESARQTLKVYEQAVNGSQ